MTTGRSRIPASYRPLLAIVLATPVLLGVSVGHAQEKNLQKQLFTACKKAGVPHYQRRVGNTERLYMDFTKHLGVRKQLVAKPGTDVLEICHTFNPQYQHTFAMFDGEGVQFQYLRGTSNWRLTSPGVLANSASGTHGVMIQLSKSEGTRLRDMLSQARTEQGDRAAAGANWEAGRLKTAFGGSAGNCTSKWTDAKIGDNGETLAQICGLNSNGSPRGFQRELEANANQRAFGVWIVDGPHAGKLAQTEGQVIFQ